MWMGCGMALYYCNIGWLSSALGCGFRSVLVVYVESLLGLTGRGLMSRDKSARQRGNARIQTVCPSAALFGASGVLVSKAQALPGDCIHDGEPNEASLPWCRTCSDGDNSNVVMLYARQWPCCMSWWMCICRSLDCSSYSELV
jgi:hypothetical protein